MAVHGFGFHGRRASQGLEGFAELGCNFFARPLVGGRILVLVAGGGVRVDAGVFAGGLFDVLIFSEGVAELELTFCPRPVDHRQLLEPNVGLTDKARGSYVRG